MSNVVQLTVPRKLPVYPELLPGESYESYALRLAYSNVMTLHTLKQCFGLKKGANTDSIDRERAWVELVSGRFSNQTAQSQSLWTFRKSLGRTWQSWLTPKSFRRYCPLCLKEDRVPYVRLVWRLGFYVACSKHQVLLESKCGHCGREFKPTKPNPYFSLDQCYACGSRFSSTQPRGLAKDDVGLVAITEMTPLAMMPKETAQPTDVCVKRPFEVLLFLVSVLRELYFKGASAYHVAGNYLVPREEAVMLGIVGKAWDMMGSAEKLEDFASKNQGRFNVRAHRVWLPPDLGYLRKPATRRRLEVNWSLGFETANKANAKGDLVSGKLVARELGVGYGLYCERAPPELKTHVMKLRNSRKDNLVNLIARAIDSAPVSQSIDSGSLSELTGISRSVLRGKLYKWSRSNQIQGLLSEARQIRARYFASFLCLRCDKSLVTVRRIYGTRSGLGSPKGHGLRAEAVAVVGLWMYLTRRGMANSSTKMPLIPAQPCQEALHSVSYPCTRHTARVSEERAVDGIRTRVTSLEG